MSPLIGRNWCPWR